MSQTVRVYADGRLCIPATVLNNFRQRSKARGKKPAVWVSLFDNGKRNPTVLVTWNECSGTAVSSSKKYDLSVRDRVLFGPPKGAGPWKAGQEFSYHVNALSISVALIGPAQAVAVPKAEPKLKPKPKKRKPGRPRKVTSLEKQFDASFRVKLCEIVAQDFPEITLGDLAKVMPDLTIGEIVSA